MAREKNVEQIRSEYADRRQRWDEQSRAMGGNANYAPVKSNALAYAYNDDAKEEAKEALSEKRKRIAITVILGAASLIFPPLAFAAVGTGAAAGFSAGKQKEAERAARAARAHGHTPVVRSEAKSMNDAAQKYKESASHSVDNTKGSTRLDAQVIGDRSPTRREKNLDGRIQDALKNGNDKKANRLQKRFNRVTERHNRQYVRQEHRSYIQKLADALTGEDRSPSRREMRIARKLARAERNGFNGRAENLLARLERVSENKTQQFEDKQHRQDVVAGKKEAILDTYIKAGRSEDRITHKESRLAGGIAKLEERKERMESKDNKVAELRASILEKRIQAKQARLDDKAGHMNRRETIMQEAKGEGHKDRQATARENRLARRAERHEHRSEQLTQQSEALLAKAQSQAKELNELHKDARSIRSRMQADPSTPEQEQTNASLEKQAKVLERKAAKLDRSSDKLVHQYVAKEAKAQVKHDKSINALDKLKLVSANENRHFNERNTGQEATRTSHVSANKGFGGITADKGKYASKGGVSQEHHEKIQEMRKRSAGQA